MIRKKNDYSEVQLERIVRWVDVLAKDVVTPGSGKAILLTAIETLPDGRIMESTLLRGDPRAMVTALKALFTKPKLRTALNIALQELIKD